MKSKINSLVLALALCISQSQATQYVWTQKTAPPTTSGMYDAVSFSINNKIYVAGGCSSGLTTNFNATWEYNTANDVWTQKAAMPLNGTYGSSAFVLNGEGYVMGGWHRTGSSSATALTFNYKYNPASNAWSSFTPFPGNNRYTAISFELDGKGYFGTGYSPLTNDLWEYDPLTSAWTQKANFPGGVRQAAIGFSSNGKGYIGLGGQYTTLNADLWSYDPVNNSWLQKAACPASLRAASSVFELNGEIFLLCGSGYVPTPFQDIYTYNTFTDTWNYFGIFPGGSRFCMSEGTGSGKAYVGQGCYSSQSGSPFYPTTNDWWELSETTSISEIESDDYVHLIQSAEFITFSFSSSLKKNTDIVIFDMSGKLVSKLTLSQGSKELLLSKSKIASGTYVYCIQTENKKFLSGKFSVN